MHKNLKNRRKLELHRETLVTLDDQTKVAGGTTYGCTETTCDLNRCLNQPLTHPCA